MRIGIIGGFDRAASVMQGVAEANGHQLELHTGVMAGGASSASLRALVGRAELVVIITEVNSHNAVLAARREARLRQRPLKIVRRMGPSQLAALLRELPKTEAA